jgi:hypothetical protein
MMYPGVGRDMFALFLVAQIALRTGRFVVVLIWLLTQPA